MTSLSNIWIRSWVLIQKYKRTPVETNILLYNIFGHFSKPSKIMHYKSWTMGRVIVFGTCEYAVMGKKITKYLQILDCENHVKIRCYLGFFIWFCFSSCMRQLSLEEYQHQFLRRKELVILLHYAEAKNKCWRYPHFGKINDYKTLWWYHVQLRNFVFMWASLRKA